MWLLYSFLMFAASNALYLFIRQAQKEKISTQLYSVAMFLVPSIAYFLTAIINHTSLILTPAHFLLVIFTAFFWSYLGNLFSQKAILFAPNPGYSLIIQKSYVVITTIASIFLFNSELSYTKALAIAIILTFLIIMNLGGKTKKIQSQWIALSIGAHLCFAFGSLMSKYFLNLGLFPYIYLFYINLFVVSLNLTNIKDNQEFFKLNIRQKLLLLLIGIFSIGFNYTMQLAYKFAPNPGYVVAINSSSIMSLTLFSALFFKDNLSKQKLIGIIGILFGLLIITFS